MKHKGFTIVELLIVTVIIGLIAGIAIPKLANTKERAQVAAMKSDLRNLVSVEENYFAENLRYSADLGGLYKVSAGNRMPNIKVTPDGWTASITSAASTQTCAVFMGSTSLAPAVKEGAPACEKPGTTTPLP